MALLRRSAADRFRRCPGCGSSAVRAATHEPVGPALHWWTATCGECGHQRAWALTRRETRELQCWLASDRALIEEALARSRWADLARELGPPSVSARPDGRSR